MYSWVQDVLVGIAAVLLAGIQGVIVSPTTDEGADYSDVPTRSTHLVTHVIDGDTIEIAGGERVRLYGIDTPERGACYFAEATDFLRDWIEGEVVLLERDVRNRDVHDRLLRYVFASTTPDGVATSTLQLVNLRLVADGFARSLPIGPDERYRRTLYEAQQSAQADAVGKWDACAS